jgi:phenylalanyl-tRNA synthetase beta chain
MLVSLDWLKRYVNLDGLSPDDIAAAFPLLGLEVETVRQVGLPPLDQVVVGEVISREQHPNADRLGVCQVSVEEGGAPRQIVCGATNYKVGDRVPVALPGAVLPGGFAIKESKLRGVDSSGMMCSARELGLGEDHEGLLILTERPPVGQAINHVFPDNDTVFELELTANRGDCLGMIGVARDLAAWFDRPLTLPQTDLPTAVGERLIKSVDLHTPACSYYTAHGIAGVKVGPSPDWLKRDLDRVGLRPINNVVDITNWVMLETGQPLHAFDLSKIRGGRLQVRAATEGETLITLDEKKRLLKPTDAVIADDERALVIAGIMGGVDAEVDESTTAIILESAWFKPGSVLATDSSHRFARNVDPAGVLIAARRAASLILELAGGSLQGEPIVAGETPRGDRQITFDPDFLRERTGMDVDDQTVTHVFRRLGFIVDAAQAKAWSVTVPSFRPEVDRPIDLVEEFIRIYGTDKIPATAVMTPGLAREDDATVVVNRDAASYLVGRHYQECVHYTLQDAATVERWAEGEGATALLALDNPLTEDQTHLRSSLLPGLLHALRHNRDHGLDAPGFFETGRVFEGRDKRLWELCAVAFVVPVDRLQASWKTREAVDFFAVRRELEQIAQLAGIDTTRLDWSALATSPVWQEGHAAEVGATGRQGWRMRVGLLDLKYTTDLGLETPVLAAEWVMLPERIKLKPAVKRFSAFSTFPAATRDIALVVPKQEAVGTVQRALDKIVQGALPKGIACESVSLFDVYAGKGLPEDSKSLAFSMLFRAPDRTLNDKEMQTLFDQIITSVPRKTAYTVRA